MKSTICQVKTWFRSLLAQSGRSKTSLIDNKNEGKVGCFSQLFCRGNKHKHASKDNIEGENANTDETVADNVLQSFESSSFVEQNPGDIILSEANISNQEPHEMSVNDFELLSVIGKGTFGRVILCREKTTGHLYAMKKLNKLETIKMNMVTKVRAEQKLLSQLNHDFIVKLYSSFQDDEHFYLIMEYNPGGDLITLLTKSVTFTEDQARFYIAQTILAIEHIHEMNYVHRDIKPGNILLDRRGHVKLCDFGVSKDLSTFNRADDPLQVHTEALSTIDENNNLSLAYSIVGSPYYLAPELLTREGYGIECDWWSLGVTMYMMLVGCTPFGGVDQSSVYAKIEDWEWHLQFPLNLSEEALDLMKKLLCDAKDRLGVRGADEIKCHPWFKGIQWDKLQEMEAPHIPQINDELDTQNFDEFEEDMPSSMRISFLDYTFSSPEYIRVHNVAERDFDKECN